MMALGSKFDIILCKVKLLSGERLQGLLVVVRSPGEKGSGLCRGDARARGVLGMTWGL